MIAKSLNNETFISAEKFIKLLAEIYDKMNIGFHLYHLENINDDRTLRMIGANKVTELMTGISLFDVIGKTLDESFPKLRDSGIPQMYANAIRTKNPIKLSEFEYTDNRVNKAIFNLKAFPLEDNFIFVVFENLSELKRTQEALKESEEHFRTLTDTGNVFFWTSGLDKKCDYFNKPWLQFRGRTIEQELNDGWLEGVHPDDLKNYISIYFEAFNKKEKFNIDFRLKRFDGKYCWLNNEGNPRYNSKGDFVGYFGHCIDISERKTIEAALNSEKILLRTLIDSIPDGLYIKDLNARKVISNPQDVRILGFSSENEVIGKSDFEMLPEEIASECYADDMRVIKNGEIILNREEEIINEKGERQWLVTSKIPLYDADKKIIGLIGIGHDITKRKIMESQLLQAQKLESIGQLAAGIAHEINTPTQYVGDNITFLKDVCKTFIAENEKIRDLIKASEQGEDTSKIIEEIKKFRNESDFDFLCGEAPDAIKQAMEGVDRISSIVKAMKGFSHPGTESKVLVNINELIENTVIVSRNVWKYVSDVQTDYDITLPDVLCLPAQFNQIILNLIVNAAHAIEEKFGKENGKNGLIRIVTRQKDNNVIIEISDNGSGIPDEIKNKIFNPFFTTKEVGKGTGQGLSIARDIVVNKHKGSIDFNSVKGKGTTFKIVIPFFSE